MRATALVIAFSTLIALLADAAPDEEALGKRRGYPVGNAANWYWEESVRVGSFTHQAEIKGIFRGKPNVLSPSTRPMPLPKAAQEPDIRWNAKDARGLTLEDYLRRQRIMGLIVVKDGVVQLERYQYDRKASDRFTSHSMAKSITALAVGIAAHEGRITSLDDIAERYARRLTGTVLGQTTLRNLLRMASGIKYQQTYDRSGDPPRFSAAIANHGIEAAIHTISERELEQGKRFYYASPHTVALAAAVRGATNMSLSEY
jgi:CubicO group peptidase (beta-lactamase class C family)